MFTHVEYIARTLTLTFEGFKTIIVVLNHNPKYDFPPPEDISVVKSYLGLGLLSTAKS